MADQFIEILEASLGKDSELIAYTSDQVISDMGNSQLEKMAVLADQLITSACINLLVKVVSTDQLKVSVVSDDHLITLQTVKCHNRFRVARPLQTLVIPLRNRNSNDSY